VRTGEGMAFVGVKVIVDSEYGRVDADEELEVEEKLDAVDGLTEEDEE